MKIYRVVTDSNNKSLRIQNEEEWISEMQGCGVLDDAGMLVQTKNHVDSWKPPTVDFETNETQAPNFYYFLGTLIFDKKVYHSDVLTHLEMSGEILPAQKADGSELFILNAYHIMNIVDAANCDCQHGKLTKYAFHTNRIEGIEYPLFRVPKLGELGELIIKGNLDLLTIVDDYGYDLEEEFKTAYEQAGLTGLKFEEVWDSEKK